MRLEGERTRVPQWIRGDSFVLETEVEAVIPVDDQSEPCLEPDVCQFLDYLHDRADARDFTELEKHGTIYMRRSA